MAVDKDETLLAERIGQLETEKEQLKDEIRRLKSDLESEQQASSWLRYQRYLACAMGYLVLAIIVGFGCWLVYKTVSAPHTVDFCTVETHESSDGKTRVLKLIGHVPWGNDKDMGVVQSADQGAEIAKKIGCSFLTTGK
jgi:hypothetical protein